MAELDRATSIDLSKHQTSIELPLDEKVVHLDPGGLSEFSDCHGKQMNNRLSIPEQLASFAYSIIS